VEEFVFYLFGFMLVLLAIWADNIGGRHNIRLLG
jgi:hypothetical protein